jgi:hypothetical protein
VAAVSPRSPCRPVVCHPGRDHPGHQGGDLSAQRACPAVGVGPPTTIPTPPTTRLRVPPLRNAALVLQSQFAVLLLVVGASGGGLMASSPDRPAQGERRIHWWAPDQAGQQPAQLGDGKRDQHAQGGHHHRPPTLVVGSVTWARVTARNASAVMARVLGRAGARCWSFDRSVSPARPPNRTCDFHRIRLSTGSRRGSASGCRVVVHGVGMRVPR